LLSDLGPEHFADWRDRRLSEVSPATVLREWNLLSAICTRAVKEWRWLPNNPMSQVSRPQSPPPRTRRVTDEEVERILLVTQYDPDSPVVTASQRVALAFLFALETAMRAREICALRAEDIDLERKVAHVRAKEQGARKTGNARTVPLSSRAVALVRQALASDDPTGDRRVFGLRARNLDAMWRKCRWLPKPGAHRQGTRLEPSRRRFTRHRAIRRAADAPERGNSSHPGGGNPSKKVTRAVPGSG